MKKDLILRFLAKVNKTETCWLWLGAKNQGGYGIFTINSKNTSAHRWFYEHSVSIVEKVLDLDHLCRTRHCVNPSHLEPVTRRENVLRGVGPEITRKRQIQKTHCPKGHEYNEKNTYNSLKKRNRRCKICHKLEERKRRQTLKEKEIQCSQK